MHLAATFLTTNMVLGTIREGESRPAYSSMVRHSRRDTVDVKMLGCLIVPKVDDLIRAVEVMQL